MKRYLLATVLMGGHNGHLDPARRVFVLIESACKKVWAYRPHASSE